jgi:photosystem II stability/assembly factor-like uncharacterized protein
MKRKLYLIAISLYIAIGGYCQTFIPMNLNYQDPVTASHWPKMFSITDASTVWLGTLSYNMSYYQVPYAWAVHTNDGGDTWQFDSIPAGGTPVIMSLSAADANTCFYVTTNIDWSNSSIWKTGDGGATWAKKNTTQFTGNGAFCDFYHAFDANEGVAVGDPMDGYFEIQRTTDGGDTWTRVPASSIPPNLPSEWGFNNIYSAIGDNVWFAATMPDGPNTWNVRCYRSTDRGQNWTVAPVAGGFNNVAISFSTDQKGVILDNYAMSKYFYRTSDGGDTWVKDSLEGYSLPLVSVRGVQGFDGGFVMGLFDTLGGPPTLLWTPDFFANSIILSSDLGFDSFWLDYQDSETGWICGYGTNTNSIVKWTGLLTSVSHAAKTTEQLVIIPNPTTTEALVKLPVTNDKRDLQIMIFDASGKLCESRPAASATGWTKLDASAYKNGVYLLQVVSGDHMIANTKWVVQH